MTIDLKKITADTLQLSRELIQRPSVTPKDEGCQALMIERLQALGFKVEKLRFVCEKVMFLIGVLPYVAGRW